MAEKRINLLHIDDDNIDRMVVQRVLKKNSFISTHQQAQNGEEALDMLRGTNGKTINPFPNIILLDINMPKMNGIEFLKELRSDDNLKQLPVFILTTSNDDNDRMKAYQYHVAGYILKPLDLAIYDTAFQTLTDFWMLCELPSLQLH